MIDTQTLLVSADKDIADALDSELSHLGVMSQVSVRRNLDGETATWIVAATLSGQALPHILAFLEASLSRRRVKRIKFGEFEIENPGKEDLANFRKMIEDAASGSHYSSTDDGEND